MSASFDEVLHEAENLTPEEQKELVRRLLSKGDIGAISGQKPIWEVICEISSQVPPEEWDRVPDDGSINIDHYLYGASKQEP